MKKITAVLISVMMLFAFASVNAIAQDSDPVSGQCGDNATWYYDGATSTLTVTGTGRMYDFSDGYLFNRKNRYFKNIVISGGITHIGAYAFLACYDTESVLIGKDVTSIGKNAFNCIGDSPKPKFTSIEFPDGLVDIGAYAFAGCGNLKEIKFKNNVAHIGYKAFNYCSSLKNASIPNSVSQIDDYAFGFCMDDYDPEGYDLDGNARPMKDFVITAGKNSAAKEYAYRFGVNYNDSNGCKNHDFDKTLKTAVKKVCSKNGGIVYNKCKNCESARFSFLKKGHDFKKGSGSVVRKATYFKCEIKTKYCEYCKKNVKIKTYKKVPNITIKAKNNAFKNKIEIKVVKIPKRVSYYEIRIKNNSGNRVLKKVKSKSGKVVFDNLKSNRIYKIQYRSVVSKNGKSAKSDWYQNRVTTKR